MMQELAKQFRYIMTTQAEKIAIFFHDTYEKLAPEFGYETRKDTKRLNKNWPNGKLMIAVCERYLQERVLPSQHQIGDQVFFNLWSASVIGEIHEIHFTASKVKYDLNVFSGNGEVTRIYNIDSAFISKTKNKS